MKEAPVSDTIIDEDYPSDEDAADEEQLKKLQEAVTELDAKRIRPVKRNELGALISEFHVTDSKASLKTKDLIETLEKKKKKDPIPIRLAKKLVPKAVALPKPLEKPAAQLIQRKTGFEIVKDQLKTWDAVVESHRVADHMVFPLNQPKGLVQEPGAFFDKFANQTELDRELNQVLHGDKPSDSVLEKDDFPLTMEELIERRKELAAIRARQSYREAKLKRQSKIKSKKYHRILKKEKLKNQIKEFELLKKNDPAAALQKLDELEKTRAKERATLKHRNTGKWAQSLAVRAKYDEESRKALAEQLSISRQVTQKLKSGDSSDEEELDVSVLETAMKIEQSNPWSLEVSDEVNSFISGFRKYWQKHATDFEKIQNDLSVAPAETSDNNEPVPQKSKMNGSVEKLKLGASDKWHVSPVIGEPPALKPKAVNFDIDDAFDSLQDQLARKVEGKLKKLKSEAMRPRNNWHKQEKRKTPEPSLKMKKSRWHVERVKVDEELLDTTIDKGEQVSTLPTNVMPQDHPSGSYALNIDPSNFLTVKKTSLNTPLPDDIAAGDDQAMEDDQQQQLVMEAFADDNIADFQKAKEDEEEKTQPEVVQELPGWGCWGGAGISTTKRRRKRFLQMPALPPRKDHDKPDLIINEEANPKVKDHMVREVPYPFKSVEAFEANIRAPISRNWVPELAHRELIRPAVLTSQGAIIEPLSDEILIRNAPKPKSVYKPKVKSHQKI